MDYGERESSPDQETFRAGRHGQALFHRGNLNCQMYHSKCVICVRQVDGGGATMPVKECRHLSIIIHIIWIILGLFKRLQLNMLQIIQFRATPIMIIS